MFMTLNSFILSSINLKQKSNSNNNKLILNIEDAYYFFTADLKYLEYTKLIIAINKLYENTFDVVNKYTKFIMFRLDKDEDSFISINELTKFLYFITNNNNQFYTININCIKSHNCNISKTNIFFKQYSNISLNDLLLEMLNTEKLYEDYKIRISKLYNIESISLEQLFLIFSINNLVKPTSIKNTLNLFKIFSTIEEIELLIIRFKSLKNNTESLLLENTIKKDFDYLE